MSFEPNLSFNEKHIDHIIAQEFQTSVYHFYLKTNVIMSQYKQDFSNGCVAWLICWNVLRAIVLA